MKNKYEKAIDRIVFNYGLSALDGDTNVILDSRFNEDIKAIMELVEKSIPFKPLNEKYVANRDFFKGRYLYGSEATDGESYCRKCGQRLEWSVFKWGD